MSRFTTRPATASDWQVIQDALLQAGLPVDDLAADAMPAFLVAEASNGELHGAVAVERHGEVGLLRSLVVLPAARGRGVAKRLVAEVTDKASSAGISELWLLTIDADGFFAGLGYERAERQAAPEAITATREFSDLCPASAVLMRRRV